MGVIDVPKPSETVSPKAETKEPSITVDLSKIREISGMEPEAKSEDGFSDEDVEIISLKRKLDVPSDEYRYDKELKWLLKWTKDKGMTGTQVLTEMRKIEYKLGLFGQPDKVRRIYQYLKIDNSIRDLVDKQNKL